ncbi:Putative inorganic phosphate cotransporter [Gryllus bimaculatus]|nr:Putative inorganic phosphate cotransporter [Gryllus bimaculatus]
MAAAGKKTSDSQLEPADYPQDTTDAVKCRYVFGLLGFLGMAILYSLRVNLSVAIVTMVNSTGSDSTDVMDSDGTCEAPDSDGSSSSSQSGEFEWNEEMQGFVLSGFFWGYAAGQLPGGLLAERYGGKLVFGLGVFLTALLTLLTAVAAHAHWSVLFAVRVLEGLAESWLNGWPLVFYVTGALGVIWYLPWLLCVFDSPAKHPRITPEERRYIETSLGSVPQKRKLPVPWKKILTTRGLWACASMHLGIGWTFFALLTCLPTYMSYILHYDIKSNAALSAIPYIAGGSFSFVFSWCLDHIITTGKVSKINGYRIFNGITAIGPAATLLIITAVGCDKVAILVLLAINGLCLGAQYTGNSMNLLTLAPNFAGTMLGISNTFANGAGILAPYAVGFLTNDNQTRTAWNIVFWISAAIGLVTYFIYLIFSTADEQPWNNPPDVSGESGKHKSLQGVDNKAYE